MDGDRLSNYRLALFSSLGILLALVLKSPQSKRETPHPFCTIHPMTTTFCARLSLQTPAPTAPPFPTAVRALTETLVAIPSVSGHELPALQYAAAWLKHHGFEVTTQPVPPLRPGLPARQNILATRPGVSPSAIRVVLSTHLDVVPGVGNRSAPTSSRDPDAVADVHGRGSVDAKGQAAAMLIAALSGRDARVAVLLVAGEETDHAGMLRAHELGLPDDVALVNGEPTESRVVTFQKGMLKALVRVQGTPCHSGYPELGSSAVHVLVDILHELMAESWPSQGDAVTTLNVGEVAGGTAPNVLAASAWASVMFRLAGSPEPVEATVRRILDGHPNASLEIVTQNAPFEFFAPPRAAEALGTATVAYNTDVPYYDGKFRRAVLFGAGSITKAHTDDEWVEADELEALPGRLIDIVDELLEIDAAERAAVAEGSERE